MRRAFLCGEDALTGRNFDHRKTWVVDKLATLTEIFALDLCAYALMVGHVHRIEAYCERTGWQQAKGSVWAARLYKRAD